MMKWDDFLLKIQEARKRKISLGFTVHAVIKMIYSGAMNSMVSGIDRFTGLPPYKRCEVMSQEVVKVSGSKASMPRKTKLEPIGIADITSDARLILWRHSTNPLFEINLASYFRTALQKNMHFEPNKVGNIDAIPMSLNRPPNTNKPSFDLLSRWEHAFTQKNMFNIWAEGARYATVMGIVISSEEMIYKGGKKRLSVVFFDGHHEYNVTMWPPWGKDTYNYAIASTITPCEFGLFMIKPSVWKGEKGGSLVNFTRMIS